MVTSDVSTGSPQEKEMIKDLTDIYDPPTDTEQEPAPGPGPKRSAGTKASTITVPVDPGPGPVRGLSGPSFASISPTNVKEYIDYMPEGVNDERGNREGGLGAIRGLNQSFGQKLGRKMLNLIPNLASDIVDMAGNMGSLLSEWGDNRDYTNVLNEAAASMKDPFGEVYHHDNSTWAIGDSAWWLDNVFNTAEYAGSFAIGGAGIAKGLGGIAELLGGGKLAMKVAQMGTSAAVSYAEAAQAGAQVFKETYDTQLQKALASGISVDEAKDKSKHIAAQSAATAAQLGTILTMGINAGAYSPWFKKSEDVGLDIIAKRIRQAQGEGAAMSEIGDAVRGIQASDFKDVLFHHDSIKSVLGEMAKEGGEEWLQQFAQVTGTDTGKEGKIDGFISQFGELGKILDRTANSQGVLSFALGAAFGGIQHQLIHNILPFQRIDKVVDGKLVQKYQGDEPMVDKNGAPVTEKVWVTPRAAEHDFTKNKFEDLKDSVARDYQRFDELHDQILEGLKNNDPLKVDEARDALFNTAKLHAVQSGLVDPWIKTFEGISAMAPEDAIKAGYATDENDTGYKDKAQEAVQDIGHLRDMYTNLQSTYGEGDQVAPLIDMVFGRQADLYSSRKRMDKFKTELEKAEQAENGMAKLLDPAGFSELVSRYERQRNSAIEVERQLVEDHAALLSKDPKKIMAVLRKYRATGYGDGNVKESMIDLSRKLKDKQAEVNKRVTDAEEIMLASTEYSTWLEKNPGKSFDQYLEEVGQHTQLGRENRYSRAILDKAEAEYSIAQKNLSDMTSTRSTAKFAKKVTEWQEQMVKAAQQQNELERKRLAEVAKDKSTADRLDRITLNSIAEEHKNDRNESYQSIRNNNVKLETLRKEFEKKSITGDPLRFLALKRQINELERDNRRLKLKADKADSLYHTYTVTTEPETKETSVEEITGEEDGKITKTAAEDPTTTTVTRELTPEEQIEADFNAMMDSQEVASEEDPLLPSIKDELHALTQQVAEEEPAIEEYDVQLKKAPTIVKQRITEIVDGLINGDDFSLDALNSLVGRSLTLQQAHNLLLAAKDYAKAVVDAKVDTSVEVPEPLVENSKILKGTPKPGEEFYLNDGYGQILFRINENTGKVQNFIDGFWSNAGGDNFTLGTAAKLGYILKESETVPEPSTEVKSEFNPGKIAQPSVLINERAADSWLSGNLVNETGQKRIDRLDELEKVVNKSRASDSDKKLSLDAINREKEKLKNKPTVKSEEVSNPVKQQPVVSEATKWSSLDSDFLNTIKNNEPFEVETSYDDYHSVDIMKIFARSKDGRAVLMGLTKDKANWSNIKDLSSKRARKITPTTPPIQKTVTSIPEVQQPEASGVPIVIAPVITSTPVIQVSKIEAPEVPIIDNSDPETGTSVPENNAYHAGYKIIEYATMGATSTISYKEGMRKNKQGQSVYFKTTVKDTLTPGLNENILKPGAYKPGHPLRYEVDLDYDGPKNISDSLSWDENQETIQGREATSDYLDENGKVINHPDMVGNVPIKVIDAVTGQYIMHIHKHESLNAQFPGTSDYRNLVQYLPDGEGGVIDNVALQNEILMDLRKRIVDRFNKDGSASEGEVGQEGKGTGRLILNHVITGKSSGMNIKSSVVPEFAYDRTNPEKSMLPDESLTLVIAEESGVLLSGFQFKFPGTLGIDKVEVPKGSVSAMVPAANGLFMLAPLIGQKLVEEGKFSIALQSVKRVIELYLLNDGSVPAIAQEIKELQKNTGFDVGTSGGLRSFIHQYYTYLQGFQDSALSPNAKGEDGSEKFVFNIDDKSDNLLDKTKQIKAGFTRRGKATYANLENGQLSSAFFTLLQEGFATRSRIVNWTNAKLNLKGINSTGKFRDAVYDGKAWRHNEYDNYNQYVKSFSLTPVYGRNKLSDGTYVYTANPHMPMDFSALRQETALVVEPNETRQEVHITPEEPANNAALNDFEAFSNFSYRPAPAIPAEAIGTGPESSKPLSVKTLEEIYNFTPEDQRNGKTIQEALNELTARGHTFISNGYNPFSSCL